MEYKNESKSISKWFFRKKIVACTCGIASFICVLISFVSPYWLVSWPRIHTPFDKLGLWEFCMDGFVDRRDEKVVSFFGCWWIFAPYYDQIREMLTPPWFRFIQLFVTLAFLLGLANAILLVVYASDAVGLIQRRSLVSKVLYYLNIFIFFCLLVANIIFAFKHNDPYWMPTPSLNWPSWSYGLSCLANFFSGFAIIVLFSQQLVDIILLDDEQHNFPMSVTNTSHLSSHAAGGGGGGGGGTGGGGVGSRRYVGEKGASTMPLRVREPGIDTTV